MTVFRPSLPPPSWTTTRTRLSGTPGRLVSCATSHGLFIASAVRVMNEGAVQPTATMVRPFLMNSRRVIPWFMIGQPPGNPRQSLRGAKRRSNLLRKWRSLRYARDDKLGPASLAMTDMCPEFESCDLVLRHAHDQMHGGAELVGELRAVNGDRRILTVGAERAQQRPSPAWLQGRLDKPVEQLGDHISHRTHPAGIDQLIQAGRGTPGCRWAPAQPRHRTVQQQTTEVVPDQHSRCVDPSLALRPPAHVGRIQQGLAHQVDGTQQCHRPDGP